MALAAKYPLDPGPAPGGPYGLRLMGEREPCGDIDPPAPPTAWAPASGFFSAFISTPSSSSSTSTFLCSAPSQLGIWGSASSFFLPLASNSAYWGKSGPFDRGAAVEPPWKPACIGSCDLYPWFGGI